MGQNSIYNHWREKWVIFFLHLIENFYNNLLTDEYIQHYYVNMNKNKRPHFTNLNYSAIFATLQCSENGQVVTIAILCTGNTQRIIKLDFICFNTRSKSEEKKPRQ